MSKSKNISIYTLFYSNLVVGFNFFISDNIDFKSISIAENYNYILVFIKKKES